MSAHILIVDLPDDCNTCRWCTQKTYDHMHDAWKCPFVPERPITVNIDTSPRPSDCPLIPVDRVMKRITDDVEPNGYYNGWVHRACYEAIRALRDELGLEE